MTNPTDEGFVNPADLGADVSNQQIANILSLTEDGPAELPIPSIPDQPETFLTLPAGLLLPDGTLIKDVEVQELKGEHEEKITRIRQSGDAYKFFQSVLECGVTKIGSLDATPELLKDLLVGDREYLMLGIRNATFGPTVELGNSVCFDCGEHFVMAVELSDIPVRPLGDEGRKFEFTLRKGSKAEVTLPNGHNQAQYLSDGDLTEAERTTALLQQCVEMLVTVDGEKHPIKAFPQLVRENLGIADRKALVQEINERQPGPLYNEVVHTHTCGHETEVEVGLGAMFPGL